MNVVKTDFKLEAQISFEETYRENFITVPNFRVIIRRKEELIKFLAGKMIPN